MQANGDNTILFPIHIAMTPPKQKLSFDVKN